MGYIFFQIFILVDVFIAGALAAIAGRHAYAHFRPHVTVNEKPQIPAATKAQMLQVSQEEFQELLKHSVEHLQKDLDSSSEQINDLVKRFATDIVSDEMGRYRTELAKLHKQAETDMGTIKQEIVGHEVELKAQLAKEMEIEKQLLIKQIDTKLGDAVGTFLLETLQHNVDLGGQDEYLVSMLEEHKDDFKKELE